MSDQLPPMRQRLLFLIGNLDYFCTHRLALGIEAHKRGYEVHVAATIPLNSTEDLCAQKITPLTFHPVNFRRSSLNPFGDLKTIYQIDKLYRDLKPTVVHHVAMKPVLYGTLIARWRRVSRIVNALGGLGHLFTGAKGVKAFIAQIILKIFRLLWRTPSCHLIVQNPDDQRVVSPLIDSKRLHLIRGAGVDLDAFSVALEPPTHPVIISFVARLLLNKGVGELVQAAHILQERGVPARVQIVGDPDFQNPTCVPEDLLIKWKEEGVVTFLGYQSNVANVYQNSHIAVLPSYREGLPKTLLEAAACGRPIVTTDAIGCREVVDDGVTGLLVPIKDPVALANALQKLVESPELRSRMGQAGRAKMEAEFGIKGVVAQTFKIYERT